MELKKKSIFLGLECTLDKKSAKGQVLKNILFSSASNAPENKFSLTLDSRYLSRTEVMDICQVATPVPPRIIVRNYST